MAHKKSNQQVRKRDVLLWIVIVVAVLAVVIIASEIIEHLPAKRGEEPFTTPATNAEAPGALPSETDSGPEATPDTASDVNTAPEPNADPASVTAPDTSPMAEETDYTGPMKYDNNIKNFVLIGVDKRELAESDRYRTGGQSDVILIVSLNLKTKEYFIVSVNRDLVVPVENYAQNGASLGIVNEQIELAYGYGDGSRSSGRNVLKSLHALLGEDFPFMGFIAAPVPIAQTMADAIGGVEVTILDDFTGVDDTLKMGETVLLKGEHVENFIRSRMNMPDDTRNVNRMSRQIQFMESFIKKVKSECTVDQALALYDDVLEMTVSDIGNSDITGWILTSYDYTFTGFHRIDGTEGERIADVRACYITPEEVQEFVQELYYVPAE